MFTFIMTFVVIVSILLILIVLAQNPKGRVGIKLCRSNQIMGVRRTADFLEKATWTLAIALVVLSFLATITMPKPEVEQKSVIESKVKETQPSALPNFPMPTEQTDSVK